VSKRDKVAREVNHVSSKLFGRVCGAMMMVLDLLGKACRKLKMLQGGRLLEAMPTREIE